MKYPRLRVGNRARITYNPQGKKPERVWVTILVSLEGRDLVAVDKKGQMYTTWWDKRAEKAKRRLLYYRHWRRFESGLFYLQRGLMYALLEATEIRIPTIDELQSFCQDKQVELSLIDEHPATYLQAIGKQFSALERFLKDKKRLTLQESYHQLTFFLLLRDSLGRLNIGVLRARLTAINSRFAAELKHLMGWTPHYAARFNAVLQLQRHMERSVRSTRRSLAAMISHKAFTSGETTDNQIAGIRQALRRQVANIQSLAAMKPFDHWAKHCLADLEAADSLLKSAADPLFKEDSAFKKKMFTQARETIDRLLSSIDLRIKGFELEELISKLGLDLVLRKSANRRDYRKAVRELIGQFRAVDETGFDHPVCQAIDEKLTAAHEAVGRGSWQTAKSCLKEAAAYL